ncbi:MAG: primosomal protein N' [Deltaproteobacteria bacterium]|nr:primosomal protein N' [Deltaproteobacteria bacterium]MBW1937994.1 primosomal protein N' [Deltaproteobacteria bacterium]MBW2079586.1 primosomal protein N' [Deltaproteobacteria bacterium]MBW2350365.1 primosomal protein N' [Deltaproteobacteria bacterium]
MSKECSSKARDETFVGLNSPGCNQLIDVAVPLPIYTALTYILSGHTLPPPKGARVLVPVGRRNMVGVAWRIPAEKPPSVNLKRVKRILDQGPLLPESLISFLEWTSSYYFYPIGQVIAEALPPGLLSARNRRIAQINGGLPKSRGCRPKFPSWSTEIPLQLTQEQEIVLNAICDALATRSYHPILVHGVTGSGKTEVYLQAAKQCIRQNRSVLILVPEIAMTTQAVGWFISRFGEEVTVLHSGLTEAQRRDQWFRIKKGESRIVIGTRSAIFAPLSDIGLIVVDEEHDPSYKQSEKFRYQARDMALLRGRMSDATVILGSATPSVSSFKNAISGKYQLITMEKRVAERSLPGVVVVDRRKKEKKDQHHKLKSARPGWLSEELKEATRDTLERGEQVLLFLNRRGFATYVFCPDCGHVFRCPHCEVTLTWHRGDKRTNSEKDGVLRCHYCGMESAALPVCPQCMGQAVKALGYGTEKIATDLEEIFPGARIARLDRDTVRARRHMEEVVLDFRKGHLDILVGTQMITKGHDFPGLTLVGVLCADLSLNFPEYHATERTFQLLSQVAGRAGRGERPGRVIIQTWLPDHYVLDCATTHDFNAFYEKESKLRKALGYPPFGRLINLRFSGRKKAQICDTTGNVARLAKKLAKGIKSTGGSQVEVLGPAPAPRAKIKDRYRWQILLKSSSLADLRALCTGLLSRKADMVPSSVRMEVDVDPYSLL